MRQITGDRVNVQLLLPPGTESHTFDPRPSDIKRLNDADIFIYTGKYMEPWAERIVNSLDNKKLVVVDASKGITLFKEEHDHEDGDHHHEGHDHGGHKHDADKDDHDHDHDGDKDHEGHDHDGHKHDADKDDHDHDHDGDKDHEGHDHDGHKHDADKDDHDHDHDGDKDHEGHGHGAKDKKCGKGSDSKKCAVSEKHDGHKHDADKDDHDHDGDKDHKGHGHGEKDKKCDKCPESKKHDGHKHDGDKDDDHDHDGDKDHEEHEHHDHDGHDHAHHHHHEYDPHIWLDLSNASKMVGTISAALIAADPANAKVYAANTANYQKQLATLDKEISTIVKNSPRKTLVFGGRFAYLYFLKHYGLNYVTAYDSCSLEGEPGVQRIAEVIRFVNKNGVKYIFHEENVVPKVAKAIADETGAELLLFNTAHNPSKRSFERGDTFLQIMKNNKNNVAKGLK